MSAYNTQYHNRRSIRLSGYNYSKAGFYFVTLCLHNRECLFGDIVNGEMILNENGNAAKVCWSQIPTHFPATKIHAHIVMPNHIHGIIEICSSDDLPTPVGANNHSPLHTDNLNKRPNGTSKTIGSIVRGFKIGVTRAMGRPVWQRNYYEHIIRNEEDYRRIADYIANNPLTWEKDTLWTK
jgi:REP element-mobilizing transposase RayT